MKKDKLHLILYLIITTIIISILAQFYFNYKNFQLNKSNYIRTIQKSIDIATDNYFAERAKQKKEEMQLFFEKFDKQQNINTLKVSNKTDNNSITIKVKRKDSFLLFNSENKNKNKFFLKKNDSVKMVNQLETIMISITGESLNIKKIDSIFKKELERKNINTIYQIKMFKKGTVVDSTMLPFTTKNLIKTDAKSTFLKEDEMLSVFFKNNTIFILKEGIIGILLSLILSIAIISSLFYLLHIIKKQKQIAEIKNDFISNITHEFKTPITTINTAIEAIKSFQNDKLKTDEYLDISKKQLNKLTVMVDKILETSALDSDKLLLKKEKIDIISILKKIINQLSNITNKDIVFKSNTASFFMQADAFHLKNALENILDNAIKYGGDSVEVSVAETTEKLLIFIKDSGSIPLKERELIFDKFYRIPKGDTHDVKGFGIGLYYAKNIIQKHNGTLILSDKKQTVFKIELPKYEN